MSAELIKIPNLNSKIQRSNIKTVPEFLQFPIFKTGYFDISKYPLKSEETDILIILFHLYYTEKEKDGLLYINTDDILTLRSVKKNKAGYKKEVRDRIDKKIKNLEKIGIFTLIDYKRFNYILDFNKELFKNIEKTIYLNRKLAALNPVSKSWHKAIGLYLTILKNNINSNSSNIQIKKLLNIVSKTSSVDSLFPFQIRQKFENTMDELNAMKIFKGWHYKNIDEDILNSKNWLFFWKMLSVKIIF